MSQQDDTSLFFYSAGLLVHDYKSGREAPGTCESLGAHSRQRRVGAGTAALACARVCVFAFTQFISRCDEMFVDL